MIEPTPVLPLAYEPADDAARALASVVRGVTWVLVLRASVGLGLYVLAVGCYAWQAATVFPVGRRQIDGWPLAAGVPGAAVGAVMLAGAVGCLRGRDRGGRRWVVAAAAVEAVLSPITYLTLGAYYHDTRDHLRYGVAFATYTAGGYVAGAAMAFVVSAAVWLFFRQRAVRRQFGR